MMIVTGFASRRDRRRWPAAVAMLLGVLLGPVLAPVLAEPAAASAAAVADNPGGQHCETLGWGWCDTRATSAGYQYVFVGGNFLKVPAGAGAKPTTTSTCGAGCVYNMGPCEFVRTVDPVIRAGLDPGGAEEAACALEGGAVPLATAQATLVNYLRERGMPQPKVTVSPGARSFANLPTVFYSQPPPPFTLNVNQPLIATITAVPHYRWDFGDGQTGPDSPGRPYDPSISPVDHPDAYVSHAYREPGTYQATLTVTWEGTFTVPGPAQAFPLAPVVLNAGAPVVVDQAGAVLTGNG
jgi:PKD domain